MIAIIEFDGCLRRTLWPCDFNLERRLVFYPFLNASMFENAPNESLCADILVPRWWSSN